MLRLLARTLIVCAGFFALVVAAQRATERIGQPDVVLRLGARGNGADGQPIRWTFSVTEQGMMDLDGRPTASLDVLRDRVTAVRTGGGTLTVDAAVDKGADPNEIRAALDQEAEAGRLAKAKVRGLVGRLEALRTSGVDLGKLPAAQLSEAIEKLRPTAEEVAAAHEAMVELERRMAALGKLARKGDAARARLSGFVSGLRKAQEEDLDVDESSTDTMESSLTAVREHQERLKSRGVATALDGLVEAKKLAGAKVRGLVGDLDQLRAEGVKFAALTGPQLASRLADRTPGEDELAAVHKAMGRLERRWSLAVDAAGAMTLDGLAATMADFEGRVLPYVAASKEGGRTQPVTVADVMAAAEKGQLRAPQRQKVSFPGRFTYKDAFPEATDEPEYVIREFRDVPILHSKSLQAEARIDQYAGPEVEDWAALPPVADRLPCNPAVFEGPEGIGTYGGTWVRCTTGDWDIGRKIGYPSFVRHGPAGQLQPHFAYKWTVADNNRVYTFYLRKGHRWSDGTPFTSHHIAWVANVVNGSPAWPTPMDWKSATDGSILLYAEDILDWPGLAAVRLRRQAASPEPSPGRQIALTDVL